MTNKALTVLDTNTARAAIQSRVHYRLSREVFLLLANAVFVEAVVTLLETDVGWQFRFTHRWSAP